MAPNPALDQAKNSESVMKIKPSSYFLIAILIITLVIIVHSLTFPSLQTKLFPLIASGFVLVLTIIELSKELLAERKAKTTSDLKTEGVEGEGRGDLRKYLLGWGWAVGFLLAIYLVGFIIAISLFVFSYLKLNGRKRLLSAGMAIVMTMFMYVIFVVVLKVDLYPGFLPKEAFLIR